MAKDYKLELDEQLDILQIAVVKQLVAQVNEGENLRAAIDFLRLHKRSVPETAVIGAGKTPKSILDELVDELQLEDEKKLRR